MASVFKKPLEADRNIRASLYFGNLDQQVTEMILYELFIQFAPVKSLNLPKDRILRTHQGYGFVEFKTSKDAEYVLEILRGIRLFGRVLKLKRAEANLKASQSTQVGAVSANNVNSLSNSEVGAKIFINHLSSLADEQFLYDTFSKFGNIVGEPSIIRDNETGESKGYGFVSYDDFSSSDRAIEKLNGAIIMNSKIFVSYAFKEDANKRGGGTKRRHGDEVERLLAEKAKKGANTSGSAKNRDKTKRK